MKNINTNLYKADVWQKGGVLLSYAERWAVAGSLAQDPLPVGIYAYYSIFVYATLHILDMQHCIVLGICICIKHITPYLYMQHCIFWICNIV